MITLHTELNVPITNCPLLITVRYQAESRTFSHGRHVLLAVKRWVHATDPSSRS
jgi:hypothetical protein